MKNDGWIIPPKGTVLKVQTVPGGSQWRCGKCLKFPSAGEQVVKLGVRQYLCSNCTNGGVKGGRHLNR